MTREWLDTEAGQVLIRRIPMRRPGDLENLLGPSSLLEPDAPAFMTGSALSVERGHRLSSLQRVAAVRYTCSLFHCPHTKPRSIGESFANQIL